MKVWIEFLAVLFLFGIFICWLIYKKISDYFIAKKYNANDDKSRLGEEQRRADKGVTETKPAISRADEFVPQPTEVAERTIIQDGSVGKVGEDSNSNGKASNPARRFFSRFRK